MLKLTELRWRRQIQPDPNNRVDILVGKLGDNYLWITFKRGADVGPDDADQDPVYGTVYLTSRKPYNGPEVG